MWIKQGLLLTPHRNMWGYFFVYKEGRMEVKNEIERKKYNGRFFAILQSNTKEWKSTLKKLGLDYQKVKGLWDEENIIIWKTAYTYGQFRDIFLKLNAQFKQKAFCLGRKLDEQYDVRVYQTDSLDNIQYKIIRNYQIDAKEKDVKFGRLQHNPCLAASQSLNGAYKRENLLDELSLKGKKDEKC